MAARKYTMGRRVGALEDTRQRIVDATVALHNEKGIVDTTFQDIAARADVALGTVHRHFPSLDDVVMACGARITEMNPPPDSAILDGVVGADTRIEVLVRESFFYYERGQRPLEVAYCERTKIRPLAEHMRGFDDGRWQLVRAALLERAGDDALVRRVYALTHFSAWQAFHRAGISTSDAIAFVATTLKSALGAAPSRTARVPRGGSERR